MSAVIPYKPDARASATGIPECPPGDAVTAPAFSRRLRIAVQDCLCVRWSFVKRLVRGPAVAAAIIGVSLTLLSWAVAEQVEEAAAWQEIRTRAANHAALLQSGIEQSLSKLGAVQAFFEASAFDVARDEFTEFTNHLLADNTAIHNLSWAPIVTSDNRSLHEQQAVQEGLPGYRVVDSAPGDGLVASPSRPEYFPKYFINGIADAGLVYGLDLGQPDRRDPLDRARETGKMAASPIIKLRSGNGDRTGIFVVLPVHVKGGAKDANGQPPLRGFVSATFQISRLVETALAGVKTPFDLTIFPDKAADEAAYTLQSSIRTTPMRLGVFAENAGDYRWTGTVTIADRQLALVVTPIPGWAVAHHQRAALVLVAGLLATLAVVITLRLGGTKLSAAHRRIASLAETDLLTGLSNRQVLLAQLALRCEAPSRGRSFALLLIDLDHFRHVNDTLGHPVGDAFLRAVGESLVKAVRDTDIVARLGGDEFGIILTGISQAGDAAALAERIAAKLASLDAIEGHDWHVTASIGIAIAEPGRISPEALVMHAELALYRAKENGRNQHHFHTSELDRAVHDRVIIDEDLRGAIKRRELVVYYQPQVSLDSGRIIGVEALVRWTHPVRGPISPTVFIPIAEESGSIIELGAWVFDEACRQMRVWDDQGIAPPTIAINVSAVQFRSPTLEHDFVASAVRWQVPPRQIEIELTESVLMETTGQHGDVLARFKARGFRVAIDDFGTGYSPLAYLTAFPVDHLKVAQELVLPILSDSRNVAVVHAAVQMGHDLGITVIAEGVETDAAAKFLFDMGCDEAQGYRYGKPCPAAEMTTLLRSHPGVTPQDAEECVLA
ncbi:MAG: EAL domain-containing protein [Alphaproteobacteria bacterium]|nr:EAL domain-containing protein [Alphaproteobacteria bacterium]